MFGFDDLAAASTGPVVSGLFSARQAAIDRGWQEQQSSTAIQRQVADMRSAGINPILAGRYGGAPVTGGAMGSMPAPDVPGSMIASAQKDVLDEQKTLVFRQAAKAQSDASIAASEDEIRLATRHGEIDATNASNARAAAQAALEARDAAYWMAHPDLRSLHLQSSNVSSAAEAARAAGGVLGKGLQWLKGKVPAPGSFSFPRFAPRTPGASSSARQLSPRFPLSDAARQRYGLPAFGGSP